MLSSVRRSSRTNVHTLRAGGRTYIWEDGSSTVYEGSSGNINNDDNAHMPTYEDLLAVNPSDVTDGYIDSSSDCVVVESMERDSGYTQRWYVSIREGLLMEYECLSSGPPVFTALVLEARPGSEGMNEQAFALPDGTVPG